MHRSKLDGLKQKDCLAAVSPKIRSGVLLRQLKGQRHSSAVGAKLIDQMQRHVLWPDRDEEIESTPEESGGTLDCTVCRQSFFVIGYHEKPFCFYCDTSLDDDTCEEYGLSCLSINGCYCGSHRPRRRTIGDDDSASSLHPE